MITTEYEEITETMTETTEQLHVVFTGSITDNQVNKRFSDLGHTVSVVPVKESLTDATCNYGFKDLKPAIEYAQENQADVVVAIDLALGKLSVAARQTAEHNFVLLNPHQLAALLIYYWHTQDQASVSALRSIHVSEMISRMVYNYDGKCYDQIVEPGNLEAAVRELRIKADGDKWIGITENQEFYHSEKDLVQMAEDIADLAEIFRKEEKTLFDCLIDLYKEYGFYKEKTFVVDFVNQRQQKHILTTLENIRKNPKLLEGKFLITRIIDYKRGKTVNYETQKNTVLNHEKTNMLTIEIDNDLTITFMPTDGKMFYHMSSRSTLSSKKLYADENQRVDQRFVQCMTTINKM